MDIFAIEASDTAERYRTTNPAEVLNILALELADRGRDVSIAISSEFEQVEIGLEPEIFHLVARNLIENAVAYSPDGGSVRCRWVPVGKCASIAIEDDGFGIPPDELAKVTERFFRGRNRSAFGSGLGLAIVELALERNGWSLELRNRPSGGLTATLVQTPV